MVEFVCYGGYQLGMAIPMRKYAVHADYVHIHKNADVDADENLGKYRRMANPSTGTLSPLEDKRLKQQLGSVWGVIFFNPCQP